MASVKTPKKTQKKAATATKRKPVAKKRKAQAAAQQEESEEEAGVFDSDCEEVDHGCASMIVERPVKGPKTTQDKHHYDCVVEEYAMDGEKVLIDVGMISNPPDMFRSRAIDLANLQAVKDSMQYRFCKTNVSILLMATDPDVDVLDMSVAELQGLEYWAIGGQHTTKAMQELHVKFPLKPEYAHAECVISSRLSTGRCRRLGLEHNARAATRQEYTIVDMLKLFRMNYDESREHVAKGNKEVTWTDTTSKSGRGSKVSANVIQLPQWKVDSMNLYFRYAGKATPCTPDDVKKVRTRVNMATPKLHKGEIFEKFTESPQNRKCAPPL